MGIAQLILLATCTTIATAQEQQRLPNINYVGSGYDMLKGNPHPTGSGETLLDPGWRAQLFDFEHFSNNDFFSDDITYLVPDGMTARSCAACSFEFSSSDLMSSTQYKESLRVKVDADFEGWGASFKASADYQNVQEKYEETNSYFVESTGSCSFYCAAIDQFSPPPLSPNFIAAIGNLPVEYDEDDYFDFIDEFGTHYAREVEMGGVFGEQTEITATAVREMEQLGYSASLSARYSAVAASGGVDILVEGERDAAAAFASASTEQRSFVYGGRPRFGNDSDATEAWVESARANPLPLRYTLDQISDAVDSIRFPEDEQIEIKHRNLVIALSTYCAAIEAQGGIECADRDFDVTEAGNVGLPLSEIDSEEQIWDDGVEWERMGQPLLTDVFMWFGPDGLETIQGVYEKNNFRYYSDELSWGDAEQRCLRDDSRLVSVFSDAENTRMVNFVNTLFARGQVPSLPDQPNVPKNFWMGFTDTAREGLFVWTDGHETSFDGAWGPNEPNNKDRTEQCVEYRTNLEVWNDQTCTDALPFICKWPREHGAHPAQVSRPVEFNLDAGEFINAVEICEPERIGSLRWFTTQGRTSERFSLRSHREASGASCLVQTGAAYNIPAGNRIYPSDRTASDWQECQRWCLSSPVCTVWNYRFSTGTCRIGTRHLGLLTMSNGFFACPTRECRDCSETAGGNHFYALDGCRFNEGFQQPQCLDIRNEDTSRADVRCCALDGTSCTSLDCLANVTYQEAVDYCASNDLRLCSGIELNRRCCASGCDFDGTNVWTLLDCTPEPPEIDTENCVTYQFSDRLGLVHFSGAVDEDGKLANLGFNGFQEVITEQASLEIPPSFDDEDSGAPSTLFSMPTMACIALATVRHLLA